MKDTAKMVNFTVHSLFPPWQTNATGSECSCATKVLWPYEAWMQPAQRKWKPECERVDASGSGYSLIRRLMASHCGVKHAGCRSFTHFVTYKDRRNGRKKSLSREFYTQGSWHLPRLFGLWAGPMSFCYACAFILATICWIIHCGNPIERQQETHGIGYKIRYWEKERKEKLWLRVLFLFWFRFYNWQMTLY